MAVYTANLQEVLIDEWLKVPTGDPLAEVSCRILPRGMADEQDAHWKRWQQHLRAASNMSVLPVSKSFELKIEHWVHREVRSCGCTGKLWVEHSKCVRVLGLEARLNWSPSTFNHNNHFHNGKLT
jgi:hypothetical protein